ncbi:hypothetical protein EDC04DRAFT_2610549 [Pisolithus marmoratus]|nr:hypothetical protein EDC04DRAFT_2610549 [Pisolithus marmoratus]
MSVVPGPYRITTHLSPNPAIGVDPRINSAIKPVVIAPKEYAPDGTTWQVVQEDGQLYLLVVDSANTRPEEDKVCAFYGQSGEVWKIVYHPLRKGYAILSVDESLAWYLPNSEYQTQVELHSLGVFPGEGYYFNLEMLVNE